MVHLTETPVGLTVRARQHSSLPSEKVLDLFGISGSSLIARQHTGCRAFLRERDPLDSDANVREWCADRNETRYHAPSPGADPHGAVSGSDRVDRGGSRHLPLSSLLRASMLTYVVVAVVVFVIAGALAARPLAAWMQAREARQAVASFRLRRELLEAKFFEIASTLGKPRGVRWKVCDWQSDVTFARDRQTGLITAFASVNVSFEPIPGSEMEDVAHVGLLRDGCAMFHYQDGAWGTGGRVVFNMNPREALSRFESQYEGVTG